MNGINLDTMRDSWAAASRDLDTQLTMDVEAVRAALQRREKSLFRRHSGWLLAGITSGIFLTAALLAFIATHRDDLRYIGLAGLLLVLVVAELVVDGRQWRTLARLDFDRPLLLVRAELSGLRARRLVMNYAIFLSAFFLWLPILLVFVRGVFGFDLLGVLDPGFVWINQVVSLLLIPVLMVIERWLQRRFGASPAYQGFLDDVAGRSWSRAQHALDARLRFEDDVQVLGAADTLRRRAVAPVPAALVAPLRALKSRLVLATAVFALLVVATGLFNGLHGGQVDFLVPGVALHLFWVFNLVAAIVHLMALTRLDFGEPTQAMITKLAAAAHWRTRMARWALALAPSAALLLAQVLAKVLIDMNLITFLPWPALLEVATVIGVVIFIQLRAGPAEQHSPALDAMSFGALNSARTVSDAISRLAPRTSD